MDLVDIRKLNKRPARSARAYGQRGATSVQILVILVPVLFGIMGFAVDLGQLYLVKGELKAAANSMALAAAQKLIGTDASTDAASTAARVTIDNSTGFGNKYNFGGLVIGSTTGFLSSIAPDPAYFASVADATGAGDAGGGEAAGASARHARVYITGEAPLTFWSFLPIASERKIAVAAQAVAGISAPLCTACGIEVFAVGARDPSDTNNFGFVLNNKYTFGYSCTGMGTPGVLPGTTGLVPYVMLNRFDPNASVFPDEGSQAFRDGAQGLPGSTTSAQSCFSVNAGESVWASAAPIACTLNRVPSTVTAAVCGITTRFESATPGVCQQIPEIDSLASIYSPDTDLSDIDDYAAYTGNGRRVITVPIVANVTAGSMTVLGFRQFLVDPQQNAADISASDTNARFAALYIGSVVPVKQGRFDGCTQTAGPGKVVLHQ